MPHIHEKIDFTASVYIVYKDKVLLRKHDKYKMWLGPGGHIELDEDPVEAVIREAKEEVGLDIEIADSLIHSKNPDLYTYDPSHHKELAPPRFLNRHFVSESHEHVDLVYFARTKTDDIKQGANEVSDEVRWFTAKEIDDPQYGVRDDVKHYAKEALKTLSS
jgi:8-oxo-dGTP pyrophosphatase MutT (NUDIX family)